MEKEKNKKEIQPILLGGQELLRQAGLTINGLIWMEEQFCDNFSDPELIARFKKFTKAEILKIKNQLVEDLINLK